jgi:hypothetical protein
MTACIQSRHGEAGEVSAAAWMAKMRVFVEPAPLEHVAPAAYARSRRPHVRAIEAVRPS